MISVFVLDDHEVTRRLVVDTVNAQPDMRVIGTAATQLEAVGRVHTLDPDVAVLDVRLEEGNGVETCREIRSVNPRTACLLLTTLAADEALFFAIMAGAAAYVLKRDGPSMFVDAVRSVSAGGSRLDPADTARGLERIRNGPRQDERVAHLMSQERQVLDLLAEGLTNRNIADRLFMPEHAVKNFVTTILAQLG